MRALLAEGAKVLLVDQFQDALDDAAGGLAGEVLTQVADVTKRGKTGRPTSPRPLKLGAGLISRSQMPALVARMRPLRNIQRMSSMALTNMALYAEQRHP